jgi:TolB protein
MMRRLTLRPALAAVALLALGAVQPPALDAQQEELPGVRLGLVYENAYVPALGVQAFGGRLGGEGLAPRVEAIVARDLDYSDRFQVLDSLPVRVSADAVDYSLWDRLGATWVVKGTVEGAGGNDYVLVLELHDVLYETVQESGRFPLPNPDTEGAEFRMAVHRASDQVVEWVFGEPGMAASRITFALTRNDGTKEIYVVDSDGENLRRVTDHADITNSPTWSPDNTRIAYMTYDVDGQRIYEKNLVTGQTTRIEALRDGNYMTPAYFPDGSNMAFAVHGGARSGIFTYDADRECCLTNLTESVADDMSPSISPDGRWMVFNSNRLGTAIPQIYVMPTTGGTPELLSPYQYGQGGYFSAPDWSPFGDNVAFHGRVGRSGRYHILVARMGESRRLLQLTFEGNNEAPSWAPDGRHLVFRGERSWGKGLFVVDTASGRIRSILTGVDVDDPDWSGAM